MKIEGRPTDAFVNSVQLIGVYVKLVIRYIKREANRHRKCFKGIRLGKMVKMIKFLFFAQKVLRPKFLGG